MKILITGGSGYIGSMLTPALLALGHEVVVVDNFMYRQNSLLDCCSYSSFTVIRGDCRDEELMAPLVSEADAIIPLAALVGMPLCERDKDGALTTNQVSVEKIVQLAQRDTKIIIPTTNSGYGVGQKDKYCTEETPLNPISLYGTTKVNAEKAVLSRENSISLRLATVFGVSPRMRTDLLVNDFVYRAVNDRCVVVFEGHFMRNYIHIKDVVRAFIHSLDNFESMKGNAFNVGLDEANMSKLELCKNIQAQVPDFSFIEAECGEDPDKRDYIVSNKKIYDAGFRPQHTLTEGIAELIKAYQIIKNTVYGNV